MKRNRSVPPGHRPSEARLTPRAQDPCKPQARRRFHNLVWDALLEDDAWDDSPLEPGDFSVEETERE